MDNCEVFLSIPPGGIRKTVRVRTMVEREELKMFVTIINMLWQNVAHPLPNASFVVVVVCCWSWRFVVLSGVGVCLLLFFVCWCLFVCCWCLLFLVVVFVFWFCVLFFVLIGRCDQVWPLTQRQLVVGIRCLSVRTTWLKLWHFALLSRPSLSFSSSSSAFAMPGIVLSSELTALIKMTFQ